jgi:hypothetical protein
LASPIGIATESDAPLRLRHRNVRVLVGALGDLTSIRLDYGRATSELESAGGWRLPSEVSAVLQVSEVRTGQGSSWIDLVEVDAVHHDAAGCQHVENSRCPRGAHKVHQADGAIAVAPGCEPGREGERRSERDRRPSVASEPDRRATDAGSGRDGEARRFRPRRGSPGKTTGTPSVEVAAILPSTPGSTPDGGCHVVRRSTSTGTAAASEEPSGSLKTARADHTRPAASTVVVAEPARPPVSSSPSCFSGMRSAPTSGVCAGSHSAPASTTKLAPMRRARSTSSPNPVGPIRIRCSGAAAATMSPGASSSSNGVSGRNEQEPRGSSRRHNNGQRRLES